MIAPRPLYGPIAPVLFDRGNSPHLTLLDPDGPVQRDPTASDYRRLLVVPTSVTHFVVLDVTHADSDGEDAPECAVQYQHHLTGTYSDTGERYDVWYVVECDHCSGSLSPVDSDYGHTTCESCRDHLTSCVGCGDYYDPESCEYPSRPDVSRHCDSCSVYSYCDEHEQWYQGNEGCDGCNEPDEPEEGPHVLGYHDVSDWTPVRALSDTPRTRRAMFGVELEVAFSRHNTIAEVAQSLVNTDPDYTRDWHFTSDSSIGGNGHGLEFVSNPRTIAAWRAFAPRLASFTDALRANRCRAWSAQSCGAHVHVSRSALTGADHLIRLYTLMHDNSDDVQSLACREDSDFSQWCGPLAPLTEEARTWLRMTWQSGTVPYMHPDRYRASWSEPRYRCLNLTRHTTIEFRMWRASLNADTLVQQVVTTAALVAFTSDVRRFPLTFTGLRAWCVAESIYPEAIALLSRRLPRTVPTRRTPRATRPSNRPALTVSES